MDSPPSPFPCPRRTDSCDPKDSWSGSDSQRFEETYNQFAAPFTLHHVALRRRRRDLSVHGSDNDQAGRSVHEFWECTVCSLLPPPSIPTSPAPALAVAAVIHVIEKSVGGEVGWKGRK